MVSRKLVGGFSPNREFGEDVPGQAAAGPANLGLPAIPFPPRSGGVGELGEAAKEQKARLAGNSGTAGAGAKTQPQTRLSFGD